MNPIPIGVRQDTTDKPIFYLEDRRRHLACWGMTGVGKSTMLQNLAEWNIREGLGCTVIDPHGSIVENLLHRIPRWRTKDVIYINPQLKDTIGVNIFAGVGTIDQKVSAVVDAFRKMFAEAWGYSSEQILRWTCYAVLELRSPTLVTLQRFLSDGKFRRKSMEKIDSQGVKMFFTEYDSKAWDRIRAERTAPLLNKIDQFITNSMLRAVFGQTRESFDFRKAIDERRIILCNLSEGGLGKQESAILGGFIFSKLFFAGLSRQDTPEAKRELHTIVADEFQNFITAPIDYVLSESRKYGLSLCLGTQTAVSLPQNIRQAIFGNVANSAVYRVSGTDAEVLVKELSTNKQPYELQDLPDYQAFVRKLKYDPSIEAMRPEGPYLVRMYPPYPKVGDEQKKRVVIDKSNKRYAQDKDMILEKIETANRQSHS
jgi:hypothetical protein